MRLVYRVISCDGLGGSIACASNSQMAFTLSQIRVACSTMKMSSFPLETDQPTSLVFFMFLVEFHRDRGIECRGILYPAYPVLLQSPTTHIPCILQRF